jgi:hypothetical protein
MDKNSGKAEKTGLGDLLAKVRSASAGKPNRVQKEKVFEHIKKMRSGSAGRLGGKGAKNSSKGGLA